MPLSSNTHTDILVAGASAALAIDLLVFPLDTIKTRMQSPGYARLYTSAGRPSPALFRGLYQGVAGAVVATVPSSGAFFTTYEASKSALVRLNTLLPPSYQLPAPARHSAASCAAELVACAILTPAEVLKQNAQTQRRSSSARGVLFAPATRAALARFRTRPARLLSGYGALVARNLPFTALHFPLFEHVKARMMVGRGGGVAERAAVTAVSAGGAGCVAAVATTPVDVVKTRIMLRAADGAAGGTWSVAKEVLRKEGVRGLFRGGALRGAWTALGSGMYLSIYESARTYLENRREAGKSGVLGE